MQRPEVNAGVDAPGLEPAYHRWPIDTLGQEGRDERVYRLTMPEGEWRAWVTMYTPCADLSMAAIRS